jgi:hypothetical protein
MIVDNEGNKIFLKDNNIYLKLVIENFNRLLGKLNKNTCSLHVYRNYDKHLHILTNSFGFNYALLHAATKFNKIILETNKNEKFDIPVNYILSKGTFLFFKNKGFEKQIFCTLTELENFKIIN